ncbi:HD domain-containing protein [Clostridium formicaceticum]|uniref:HD domain protein n=1 Tax=Clostridium formicaceticum TaxID=1497 RepID=A0AAC9RIJ4_9CLOT|nr:HD domain-containing protein [Clostridium formicaceticum]AOY76309.1 HD domain-containing protein [Clostridium formicaceticum]ARE86696.1 HD domain protein [Clostridium formicaceticum]
MERVNAILNHPQYGVYLQKNMEAEKDRIFCRHNLQHFLDVARVGYIIALEKKFNVSKEIIYTAALLHDIGRWRQYADGTDHAAMSAMLSKDILKDCNFSEDEIQLVLTAIEKHRKGKNLVSELDFVLYEGDKKSRPCVACKTIEGCNRFKKDEKPEIQY